MFVSRATGSREVASSICSIRMTPAARTTGVPTFTRRTTNRVRSDSSWRARASYDPKRGELDHQAGSMAAPSSPPSPQYLGHDLERIEGLRRRFFVPELVGDDRLSGVAAHRVGRNREGRLPEAATVGVGVVVQVGTGSEDHVCPDALLNVWIRLDLNRFRRVYADD